MEGITAMGRNAVGAINQVLEAASIEVRNNNSQRGVFAREGIARGSVVLYLKGTISTEPSKYTIQLEDQRHLNPSAAGDTSEDLDYCWVYLNHSCEPSSYVKPTEFTLRALRDIAPGEEITFNYLTTEFEMAVPFNCTCDSPNCFGFIQGRKFLSPAEADRLPKTTIEQ
jgi:SET domain-containing protein